MTDEPKVKLPKIKLKKPKKRMKIQTIEDYVIENKIPVAKPDISAFPDLFAPKLEKKKRDDVPTKSLVLKGTPGINFYASLLVAIAENDIKQLKKDENGEK